MGMLCLQSIPMFRKCFGLDDNELGSETKGESLRLLHTSPGLFSMKRITCRQLFLGIVACSEAGMDTGGTNVRDAGNT